MSTGCEHRPRRSPASAARAPWRRRWLRPAGVLPAALPASLPASLPPALVTVLVTVLVAAGCASDATPGSGATGSGSGTTSSPAPATASAGTTTPPRPVVTRTAADPRAIRAADLRNATYKVGADERSVTLVGGVDTDERGRVTRLTKGPLYADVNRDGLDDAAIELSVTDGNGFEALWYVLVWDRGRARQVVDPFARTARCGDTVTSVAARAGAFEVRERRIDGVAGNCARPGGLPITRSVVVDHGYLRQRGPDRGYGGICPAFSANREVRPTGANFRIGPSAHAPEIGERVRVLGPTRAAYGANAHRVGWKLVGYAPPGEPIKLFGPCAWLPTAEAPSGA